MARIRNSGGYRKLRSFQTATIIYNGTYWFCEKFLDSRSRMVDQMVQAARSGRQNIAEGSRAGATSSNTELRLINVARASLEELLLDYEDFLHQRRSPLWDLNDPNALAVRNVAKANQEQWETFSEMERFDLYGSWLNNEDSFIRANALICLIHQANFLLDQQMEALETQFVEEGGYSEALAAKRLEHRSQQLENKTDFPSCPQCNSPMVLRTVKPGTIPVNNFWVVALTQLAKEPENSKVKMIRPI